MTGQTTRAPRMAMPLAREAVRQLAEAKSGCIRPVQLRRTDIDTGDVAQVLVPCGATREDKCPACARRARSLRAQQCSEGWHLDHEPDPGRSAPDELQEDWLTLRAEAQLLRDHAAAARQDTAWHDELIGELDEEITASGVRGCLTPAGHDDGYSDRPARRSRSTRRRQDAPDLPAKPITSRTIGRAFTAADGKTWRPSMFLTLTCDSYGKVGPDGVPADPQKYDYRRAARDALHFAALDRFIQNLRRYVGYDLQYFAAIEPQKRLAPHVHLAIRGTVPREDLRQVIAATYHQVWWPLADEVCFEGDRLPLWDERRGRYVDPETGDLLPTWDQALDAIASGGAPLHVARFGPKFDAQGVLAGSNDAVRCIGYLTKYLTKQLGACHKVGTPGEAKHADRLVQELRYEPCSPTCANWLRYGIQPAGAKQDLRPGRCNGKAHRREYLGYAGRRVLVSRRWSSKTLADHRADRKAWLMEALNLSATEDPRRYVWSRVKPGDADHMPATVRLLHVLADRARLESALALARYVTHDSRGPTEVEPA